MSGHEWTHDSSQAGPADASVTPDGPDQPVDDDSPTVVRSRRFPRVSLDLRGLSLHRLRRKPRPEPASDDAQVEQPSSDEAPRRKSGRVDWSRLKMASAKRETRVGLAALASFLILVIALIFNHSSGRTAVPLNIAGDAASKDDNNSSESKNEKKGDPKNGAGQPTRPATEVSAPDTKQETPPLRPEPTDRAGHDALTKPEDPKSPASKPDQPAVNPSAVAVKKPDEKIDMPTATPAVVAIKKPEEKVGQPEPEKSAPIALPPMGTELPPVAGAAIAELAGPESKLKPESPGPTPATTLAADAAKGAATPIPSAPTLPPAGLPTTIGPEPPANPALAVPGDLPPLKPGELALPPAKPADPPITAVKKTPDTKPDQPAAVQDLIGGIVGPAPERKDALATSKPADNSPPATLKPLDEPTPRVEPSSAPVQPQPLPAAAAEHVSPPSVDLGSRRAELPNLTPAPVPAEVEPAAATIASPGLRTIPTLGKFRPVDDGSEPRNARDETKVADAPPPREAVGAREQVDPILHTVQRGENFWTISRSYYGSGRYYKALHAANVKLVPVISELYVGSTIKVPPIESLDRSLFDPPSRSSVAEVASTRDVQLAASTRTPRPEDGRAVPSRPRVDVELGMPTTRPKRAGVRDDPDEPTRPTYRVRAYDTLRSIARDTLGDSHRYREILDLNREVIDDPTRLVSGQSLTLPEDAIVRDRPR